MFTRKLTPNKTKLNLYEPVGDAHSHWINRMAFNHHIFSGRDINHLCDKIWLELVSPSLNRNRNWSLNSSMCDVHALSKWHPSPDLMDAFVCNFSLCLWQRSQSVFLSPSLCRFTRSICEKRKKEEKMNVRTMHEKQLAELATAAMFRFQLKNLVFFFCVRLSCASKSADTKGDEKKNLQFNRQR